MKAQLAASATLVALAMVSAGSALAASRAPAPRTEAPRRILCLGDSHTLGPGVPPGKTYPEQLEAKLGGKFALVNGGQSGICILEKAALYAGPFGEVPHAAVIVQVGADFERIALHLKERDGSIGLRWRLMKALYRRWPGPRTYVLWASALRDATFAAEAFLDTPAGAPLLERARGIFVEQLSQVARDAARRRAALVVLVYGAGRFQDRILESIDRSAAKDAPRAVFPRGTFPRTVFLPDFHLNADGYRILVDGLAPVVRRSVLK
ncbi:MAG: hypothetical protein HY059_22835 [Proteobacteria bacterium]|nr:hypothetical protein [Pseudomonadota bacterium]